MYIFSAVYAATKFHVCRLSSQHKSIIAADRLASRYYCVISHIPVCIYNTYEQAYIQNYRARKFKALWQTCNTFPSDL